MMPTGPLIRLMGGFNEIINAKTQDLGLRKHSYFYYPIVQGSLRSKPTKSNLKYSLEYVKPYFIGQKGLDVGDFMGFHTSHSFVSDMDAVYSHLSENYISVFPQLCLETLVSRKPPNFGWFHRLWKDTLALLVLNFPLKVLCVYSSHSLKKKKSHIISTHSFRETNIVST